MVLMSRDVADPETVKSILSACGADGFVRKPFRVLTLMKKVQEISARRAASGKP
jgi:response regulator RpfG family c-di-GMP phosphodiesterase